MKANQNVNEVHPNAPVTRPMTSNSKNPINGKTGYRSGTTNIAKGGAGGEVMVGSTPQDKFTSSAKVHQSSKRS